ncbi:ribonuclease H-like domain-containing protein, partial [Tanacetum coccineum]
MRTNPGVDSLSFDDLYNNLRVFESDVKGSIASSSSTQNVAFVSENTSSTNGVSTAYGVSNSSGHNSQYEHTSSYSLLANQSSCPQLDHEDFEQLDEFDLEEMDLKWQVDMISMRMKKFYKKTDPRGIKIVGGEKIRTLGIRIKKMGEDLAQTQREQLGDASIEIQAYTQALKKVEAQLVAHQQSQLWYEKKIRFMKVDLDDKTDVLTYHKKLLAEAKKEKEDLKAKVEKWHNSSKNLNILLNSQMSAKDKAGLGYGNQMNKSVLSYENEVFQSVFVSRTSDIEDSLVNDRYAEGMHAVPPPMTGIYIPSGPDKEIDDSQFTYGPNQSKSSESDTRSSDFNSCESNYSEETHESIPKPVVNKPLTRNKKDERGVVVRNKARLVAQGHSQEEGIDYDEVFAPVAKIEAIRMFLAFASYMGFIVYQMDVKSAFLYGKIDEEVYVYQPPGFIDPKYPKKVYKVVKALYSLHQAPRAWYATLSTFLLKNGYRRGTIDKTLFIKKDKNDIMLVQVYVDD